MAGGNCQSLDYGLLGAFDQVEAIAGVGRFAINQNVYRGHSAQPGLRTEEPFNGAWAIRVWLHSFTP